MNRTPGVLGSGRLFSRQDQADSEIPHNFLDGALCWAMFFDKLLQVSLRELQTKKGYR